MVKNASIALPARVILSKKKLAQRKKQRDTEEKRLERQERLYDYKNNHGDFHSNIIYFCYFRLIRSTLEIMPSGGVTLALMRNKSGYAVIPARCSLREVFCKFEARYQLAIRYDSFLRDGVSKTLPVLVVGERPSDKQLKEFAWLIMYDYTPFDQKYLDELDPALYTVSAWRRDTDEER